MTEAIFGFIGVIVGAVASAGTTLWVTRWSFDRQVAREDQERLRTNVYAAQDAMRAILLEVNHLAAEPQLIVYHSGLEAALEMLTMHFYRIGDDSLMRMIRDYNRLWLESSVAKADADGEEQLLMLHESIAALGNPPMGIIWGLMEARLYALLHRPSSFRTFEGYSTDNPVDWSNLFPSARHSQQDQPEQESVDG